MRNNALSEYSAFQSKAYNGCIEQFVGTRPQSHQVNLLKHYGFSAVLKGSTEVGVLARPVANGLALAQEHFLGCIVIR